MKTTKMRRVVSLLLALLLCAAVLPVTASAGGMGNFTKNCTYDGRFTDVSGWYEEYVIAAYESGLINGTGAAAYSPNSTLQVSAAVTLAARIHKLYETGDAAFAQDEGRAWYKVYYEYCVAHGLFTEAQVPYGSMEAVASRNQVALILGGVLPEEELEPVNEVADGAIPDVPMTDPYAAVIYKFYRAGVLTGDSKNWFHGESSILRSEMAAIVTRLTELSPRSHVELTVPVQTGAPAETGTDVIVMDGKAFRMGMAASELRAQCGAENGWLASPDLYGLRWCTYGADGHLLLAGLDENDTVQALCAIGEGFTYCGMTAGSANTLTKAEDRYRNMEYTIQEKNDSGAFAVSVLVDTNDGDRVYGVSLASTSLQTSSDLCRAGVQGELEKHLYLLNAFRNYHGKSSLLWDENAAEAARKHANDMADNDYFAHEGLDGRHVGDRLRDEGVQWRMCGENIAEGHYMDAILALDCWVNSSGHRTNMLADYRYVGVYGRIDLLEGSSWYGPMFFGVWAQAFYA